MFTGQTNNPELRREFAKMRAASFLDASRAFYGEPRAPMSPVPIARPLPAPPVGRVVDDEVEPIDGVIEEPDDICPP